MAGCTARPLLKRTKQIGQLKFDQSIIFAHFPRFRSTMDSISDSDSEDAGSIPAGTTEPLSLADLNLTKEIVNESGLYSIYDALIRLECE
jgi:hypothetical protein